jgi:hypothetical protein
MTKSQVQPADRQREAAPPFKPVLCGANGIAPAL